MGWTYTHRPRGMSHLEFFGREFNGSRTRVLDAGSYSYTEVYLALGTWENGYVEGTVPDDVVGVVCLTKWVPNDPQFNFGFKEMTEDMGPYCYNCPERILEQLTPTENEYALRWREQCWKTIRRRKARPKLKVGDVVLFSRELTFTDGTCFRIAEVIQDGRRLRFSPYPATLRNRRYRVRREDVYEVTTISSPNPRRECNPSPFLQVLMDEWGARAVGQAHELVKQLGFVVTHTLRNPEQAAERLAELLRVTLELIDQVGIEQVETVYSDVNLMASGVRWSDLSDEEVVEEIAEQIAFRMPEPEPEHAALETQVAPKESGKRITSAPAKYWTPAPTEEYRQLSLSI